jgi:hypothetical protein
MNKFENLVQFSETIEQDVDVVSEKKISCDSRDTSKYKAIVSEKTDKVLSVVSRRYAVVQSRHVLRSVANALGKLGINDVKGSIIEEGGRTYAKVMLPRYISEGNSEKDIQLGFILINSYDTTSRISLQGFALRMVCTNGMVAARTLGTAFVHKHVGKVSGVVGDAVREIIIKIIERSPLLASQIQDAMKEIFEDLNAADAKLGEMGYGERTRKNILAVIGMKKNPVSAWDLYNAITSYYSQKDMKENGRLNNLRKAEALLVKVEAK